MKCQADGYERGKLFQIRGPAASVPSPECEGVLYIMSICVSYPLRNLDDPTNERPILLSISCQCRHVWQGLSRPVLHVIKALYSLAPVRRVPGM